LYKAGKKDKRKKDNKINVAEYVKKMRKSRMNMVQTNVRAVVNEMRIILQSVDGKC
jgi:hypothetical protein